MKTSKLEDRALSIIMAAGLLIPQKEYRFHPERKFRFDYAYPFAKIAIELEGGIWIKGAHTRGVHFNSDCEKYNAATILGWRVLRYTTDSLHMIPNDVVTLFPDIQKRKAYNDTRSNIGEEKSA